MGYVMGKPIDGSSGFGIRKFKAEELPGLSAFKTEIPKTTVVPESTVAYQVLVTYDPSNAASRAYAKLCEEIDNA